MSDPRSEHRPHTGTAARRAPEGSWAKINRARRTFGHGLERSLKQLIYTVLAAGLGLGRPRSPPDWKAGRARVLLLRCDKIGDMILITGILRAIALAQPAAAVDVLASPANAAVLDGNPHVSEVITVNKRRPWPLVAGLWRIRSRRYDAVLDPMFPRPSLTNMLLMWLSGARYRTGIAGRGNDYALTLPVEPVRDAIHHIDQTAALLSAFGVDVEKIRREAASMPSLPPLPGCAAATGWGVWPSEIYLSAAELSQGEARWRALATLARPGLRLLVNVSVDSAERLWPEECFIAVLMHLRTQRPALVPLIIGAPADAARMARIAQASGAQTAPTPHYRPMMGIVAACDVVLTGDTSVTHAACAFGKPVLTLFPDSGGATFGPYTGGYTLATPAPTLAALPAAPVIEALDALLRQPFTPRRPGSLTA